MVRLSPRRSSSANRIQRRARCVPQITAHGTERPFCFGPLEGDESVWRSASRATDIPSSRRRRKQHHQCNVHMPCAPRCPGVNMEAGNRGSERDRADVFLSRSCSGLIRPRPRERTRATLPNFHRVVHAPSPARETRRVRSTRTRRARTVGCGTSEMLDACRRGGELENRMSDVM